MRDLPQMPAQDLLVELGGWFPQLAGPELEAVSGAAVQHIGDRLAMIPNGPVRPLLHLGASRAVYRDLGGTADPHAVGDLTAMDGSFAVRFHDPDRRLSHPERRDVLGSIWRAQVQPIVDLRQPDHDLHVFVVDGGIRVGELIGRCAPELVAQPRRPFVRSYEMPARRARVLVNLSGARPGRRFLDPCAGTGSLVIEATRVGAVAIGADHEIRAASGAGRNASFDGSDAAFLATDATAPGLRANSIDAVATDLPYGRSARLRSGTRDDLYKSVLAELALLVRGGGRVVLMSIAGDEVDRSPGWTRSWATVEDARTVRRSTTVWERVDSA